MSDGGLDGLIGSKISLISTADIRYEGTLFSINAAESSIVLKEGEFLRCCTVFMTQILRG